LELPDLWYLDSDMEEAEIGLRERKKRRTRQHLVDTARRLFGQHGFEQVTVAQLAREAEVSQATVFNYFPTKEDLVFSAFAAFEERMLEAIRERPQGESVLEAFSRFILQPGGFFATADEKSAREQMKLAKMITSSPALIAREQQIQARNIDALATLLATETGARGSDLRPRVAANAMLGIHQALIAYVRTRLADGVPDRRRLWRDLRARAEAAITLLSDGLGDYARKS
jgi:AcrR family transcriptional regulator